MTELLNSPPALEAHDFLRLLNLLASVYVLGHMLGVMTSWSVIRWSERMEHIGQVVLLLAVIVGSLEAVWLDTPATIRTPLITVALICFIITQHLNAKDGPHGATRH